MWKTLFYKILNLFFPIRCINCRQEGDYLCRDCLSLIDVLEHQYCPFCSIPRIVSDGRTCLSCRNKYFLDGLFAATSFKNPILKKAIHLFKYPPFIKELAKPLTSLIITHFNLINNKPNLSGFVIVSVPLFKKKVGFRGFNQSEEIAKILAKKFNLPIRHFLIKTKRTQSQTELDREKRRKNILNSFRIAPKEKEFISDKKILLLDDVFTTGSTLNEAARILKENGAKEVFGVVIARE